MILLLAILLALALIQTVLGVRMKQLVKLEWRPPTQYHIRNDKNQILYGRISSFSYLDETVVKRSGIEWSLGVAGILEHGEHVVGPKLTIGYVDFRQIGKQSLGVDLVENLRRLQIA